MIEHDKRIAIRLPTKQRQQMDQLLSENKFKSLSDIARIALKQFLEREALPKTKRYTKNQLIKPPIKVNY
jgi:Arc/MetJ-type ribon-helix-helix transcriptional regulator